MSLHQFFNQNENSFNIETDSRQKETNFKNQEQKGVMNSVISIEQEPVEVQSMSLGDCVSEYLQIQNHLKQLRAETKKFNSRCKQIQNKMCEILKQANKHKIDINKEITLIREVSKQQVPLTKTNIRKTLAAHLGEPMLVERIYNILTEKRETFERERLRKKKYKEN